MNGGMYMEDRTPLGLYIENTKQLTRLNTARGSGNFYLQPNGVFYITTDNKAALCKTSDFVKSSKIQNRLPINLCVQIIPCGLIFQ